MKEQDDYIRFPNPLQCHQCGSRIDTVVIKDGGFYCSACGADITDQIKEIDSELVGVIAHSLISDNPESEK